MKISHLTGIALAAAVSLTSISSAAEIYVGGNYTRLEIDGGFDTDALIAKGGYKFTESLAVEGRLGFGISDDSKSEDVTIQFDDGTTGPGKLTSEAEIETLIGVYGRYSLPLERFTPYVIAGFTQVKIDAKATLEDNASSQSISDSESDTESSASFGIGTDFSLGNNFAINIEYMRYASDADGFALGANYSF